MMPSIVSAGTFKLTINPPTERIYPTDHLEINVDCQLIPTIFERFLPQLWMSSYTIIEVDETPEWLSISIPNDGIITPPDGEEHNLQIFVAISIDAPMNTTTQVNLSITTGRFMRTIFPLSPLSKEFDMDQSFIVQTGIWEDGSKNQDNTNDTTNDDNKSKNHSNNIASQDGLNICCILFLFLSILIMLITMFWLVKK
jgi:hypothetical protein